MQTISVIVRHIFTLRRQLLVYGDGVSPFGGSPHCLLSRKRYLLKFRLNNRVYTTHTCTMYVLFCHNMANLGQHSNETTDSFSLHCSMYAAVCIYVVGNKCTRQSRKVIWVFDNQMNFKTRNK